MPALARCDEFGLRLFVGGVPSISRGADRFAVAADIDRRPPEGAPLLLVPRRRDGLNLLWIEDATVPVQPSRCDRFAAERRH